MAPVSCDGATPDTITGRAGERHRVDREQPGRDRVPGRQLLRGHQPARRRAGQRQPTGTVTLPASVRSVTVQLKHPE
jgi:hypothetical protein